MQNEAEEPPETNSSRFARAKKAQLAQARRLEAINFLSHCGLSVISPDSLHERVATSLEKQQIDDVISISPSSQRTTLKAIRDTNGTSATTTSTNAKRLTDVLAAASVATETSLGNTTNDAVSKQQEGKVPVLRRIPESRSHFQLEKIQEATFFLRNLQLRPELPLREEPLHCDEKSDNKSASNRAAPDDEKSILPDSEGRYPLAAVAYGYEEEKERAATAAYKRGMSADFDNPHSRRTHSAEGVSSHVSSCEPHSRRLELSVKPNLVRRLSIAGIPDRLEAPEDDRADRPQWESDVLNALQQGGNRMNFRMFISAGRGSMMSLSSVLGKRVRDTPFGGSEQSEIKIESPEKHRLWTRRTGVSYGHLLSVEDTYDPRFLDDSNLKSGKHRVVMHLPGFMETVISFVNTKDLKRELNDKFRADHEWINPTLTLSKIRRLRLKLADIVVELEMEISTGALACCYFERLIYKGAVNRDNRKLIMGACLILAFKFNNEKRADGPASSEGAETPALPKLTAGLADLFDSVEEHLGVRKKEILQLEFIVFAGLDLGLSVTHVQIAHHMKHLKAECIAREQGEKYQDLELV